MIITGKMYVKGLQRGWFNDYPQDLSDPQVRFHPTSPKRPHPADPPSAASFHLLEMTSSKAAHSHTLKR